MAVISSLVILQSLQLMFPYLRDPTHMNVRFKNVQTQKYLYVKTDAQGKHTLGTKPLTSQVDPELDFELYFYTQSAAEETKVVLPVHEATKVCLSMTTDNEFRISSLARKTGVNETNEYENPLQFTQADNRFFYIKTSGTLYALEAINGVEKNYFLAVNDKETLELQVVPGNNYPERVLFEID